MEAKLAIVFRCIGENPERKTVEMMWTTDHEEDPPLYVGFHGDAPARMCVPNRDYEVFWG